MAIAYVGLGSNMPFEQQQPADILQAAIDDLAQAGTLMAASSLYLTEPIGFWQQPAFLNAALALATDQTPLAMLDMLLTIERRFGRDRSTGIPNGPRTLDLDLLLYDQQVFTSTALTLPHPRLAERRFVLAPLVEIAPTHLHAPLGRTLEDLLERLPEGGENGADAVRRMPACGIFPFRAS